VFNFSGSEMIFLLLLALIILGPEKLPDAVRKFGKGYAEFKKVTTGFQQELKSALDEPMREMRDTADAFKKAATFDFQVDPHAPTPQSAPSQPTRAEPLTESKSTPQPTREPTSDAGTDPAIPPSTGTASPHGDDLGASAG
jgi:sec-independent protein translocase protein TatB